MIILAVIQYVITFGVSFVIAAIEGVSLNVVNVLLAIITLIPSIIMFIGFGLFFGGMFSQNAAPGLCSAIISAASILGGIWMDVDAIGGAIATVCKVLPFYHSVNAAKCAVDGNVSDGVTSILIVAAYMAVVTVLAVVVFKKNMSSDNK